MAELPPEERDAHNLPARIEYLQAVLKPGAYYSISKHTLEVNGAEGQPGEVTTTCYFQVVRMHSRKAKPHVITTEESRTNPAFNAPLALLVQY